MPTLFGKYISVLIHCTFPSLDGIALCTWRDGKLPNITHLKAKIKTNTVFIEDKLMFADDAVFCAQTESKLQEICDTFGAADQCSEDSWAHNKCSTSLHLNQW